MACNRCIMGVQNELDKLGFDVKEYHIMGSYIGQ